MDFHRFTVLTRLEEKQISPVGLCRTTGRPGLQFYRALAGDARRQSHLGNANERDAGVLTGPISQLAVEFGVVERRVGRRSSCDTQGARRWGVARFMTKGRGVMPAAPARSVQFSLALYVASCPSQHGRQIRSTAVECEDKFPLEECRRSDRFAGQGHCLDGKRVLVQM